MLTKRCLKFTSYSKFIYRQYETCRNIVPSTCYCKNLGYDHSTYNINRPYRVFSTSGILLSGDGKGLDQRSLTVSTNDILEKYITAISTDIHQKNRVYLNNFTQILDKIKETRFLKEVQSLLLITCCTQLLVDETPGDRLELVEKVWALIKTRTKLSVNHYNELLKVYIDNNKTFNYKTFIHKMAPIKPTLETYQLIMRALAEVGDMKQADKLVHRMKAEGLEASESIFNSLIICQGKIRKPENVDGILKLMQSLDLKYSVDTYTATARAYAMNKKNELLLNNLEEAVKSGIKFGETHVMDIVKSLALVENFDPVPKVLQYLPEDILKSPSISPYMQSVATHLVFQNQPMVALEIYKCLPLPSFGPKDDIALHGRSLIRDCVKAGLPSSVIALVAQELMSSGRNTMALQNAAKAALQQGKTPLAVDLFMRMKQLGMPLRPHYFWPILVCSSKNFGEKGIMITLSTMLKMDVKPDYETILDYTLPHVSFTSPQNLMKKLIETELTVSTVLTPMMVTLLQTGQVRAASEICEIFDGKVDVEKILKPLIKGYLISADVKSTVHILEDVAVKAMNKSINWVGRFLCLCMLHKKVKTHLVDGLDLVQELKSTKLRISAAAFEFCIANINEAHVHVQQRKDNFKNELMKIIDDTLDDSDVPQNNIPQLREMDELSLNCHLTELEAKGMNTRGVLRKLLLQYCKEGNIGQAKEIMEKCKAEEVPISAGMRAAIFDLHVKLGDVEEAEIARADLINTWPKFTLDDFKIIDFATLMVCHKQIDKALNLITEHAKNRRVLGGRTIAQNCWRLLDATAETGVPEDVERVFDALTKLRYCTPSNMLLGPMIRVHLKNNDIENAVKKFVVLSNKYKKTPLKHELLCRLLRQMGGLVGEDRFLESEKNDVKTNQLVQTVLRADKKAHGAGGVQLSLIAALADVGYTKSLRRLFMDPAFRFHPDALMRYCDYFAHERNVRALTNIVECIENLNIVNTERIYEMILDVYQRDDNYEGALSIWHKMRDANVKPSSQFVMNFCGMCASLHKDAPADLALMSSRKQL